MATQCGVCHLRDSKYKCPVYCYKSHKPQHSADQPTIIQQEQQQIKRDRPGTNQRVPKVDFTNFENDADFKRLLTRYPALKAQLQLAYALTLEPGASEKWSWNRQPLLSSLYPVPQTSRGRGRGRGGRGRYDQQRGGGRGMRGGRGGRGGHGHDRFEEPPEDREHGPWTQAKGDMEALRAVKKMRGKDDEMAEGMREFVELCLIKFGPERENNAVRVGES
ncbi:hypothetical protein LTR56_020036 [Elasticomyces elasticus]|nr:hypothetical protein LTR56_020036 [Elasticomyces elasticus]KAK3634171.1 hypothetical protein LTR22_019780 [Elasticomyces elasticus]KAK4911206.1 hypothetical protein LTR49_020172 [Elasticomyces elasticus]KAK5750685.1 hypothetical protein LTS12_019216 [Elasticomyces elasticus]